MRKTTRFLAVALVGALTLSLAPFSIGSALARGGPNGGGGGSDQSCSQRGGRNNSATCVINVGDVTVNVTGNRVLSDSDNEFNAIVAAVNNEVNVLNVNVCSATGKSSENTCAVAILEAVVLVVNAFDNFHASVICVTKGHSANQCRSQ